MPISITHTVKEGVRVRERWGWGTGHYPIRMCTTLSTSLSTCTKNAHLSFGLWVVGQLWTVCWLFVACLVTDWILNYPRGRADLSTQLNSTRRCRRLIIAATAWLPGLVSIRHTHTQSQSHILASFSVLYFFIFYFPFSFFFLLLLLYALCWFASGCPLLHLINLKACG